MSKPLCFTASRSVEWQAGFALYTGDPRPYMRPSLPHVDVQEPQGSPCRLTYFWGSLALHQHHSAHGLIQALSPVEPVTLVRPHAARRAARFFIERFPGTTLYAVKANPPPDLLPLLWDSGVTHSDVASIAEATGRASCRESGSKSV